MPPPLPAHPAASVAPVDWASVRRVLAVRLDNLGDVVMVTPALRALRAALAPGARLDLLASPAGASLAPLLAGPGSGSVDEVLPLRAVWQDASGALPLDPARELAVVERIRGLSYDAVVVFTSFSQSPWPMASVAYLAGLPVRVGQSREFGGSLLSHWVTPPADEVHQVDRALHLVEAVGVREAGRDLRLDVPAAAADEAAAALRTAGLAGSRYALLAPGASCPSRRYPAQRFAAAAAALAREGLPVVVAGSDREAQLVDEVVSGAGAAGVVGVAGAVGVPGLAALVDGAAVAVTNNSGGMHLADAVRTPLVALFAGTELESQFAPRSTPTRLFRVPTDCSPCRAFACPYALECLDVSPRAVTEAALSLAGRRAAA